MKGQRWRLQGVWPVLFLLALGGCAGSLPQSGPVASPAPSAQTVESRETTAEGTLYGQGHLHAVEVLHLRMTQGGSVPGEEMAAAMNGLLEDADRSFERGDWEKAGKGYRTALRAWPQRRETARLLRKTSPEVDAAIAECSEQLMDRGLFEYRRGRMEEAIAIWERILAFSPKDTEAARAMETASRQLEKLNSLQ